MLVRGTAPSFIHSFSPQVIDLRLLSRQERAHVGVEMVILHRHVGESGLQGQLSQLLEGHPLQVSPDANVNRVSVEMPGVLRAPHLSVLVVASVSARYNARLIPGQLAEPLQHLNELRSNLNRLAMWALELIKLEVLR